MNLSELKTSLAQHPNKIVRFILPTGSNIPPHAHVTEVAQVDKRFIDCGGTIRMDSVCRLQTWFEDDTQHRLTAGKLLGILEISRSIIQDDALDVEIEHEAPFISQFPILEADTDGESLFFRLGTKHTDCLAKDRCLAPPKQIGADIFKSLPTFRQKASCCGDSH